MTPKSPGGLADARTTPTRMPAPRPWLEWTVALVASAVTLWMLVVCVTHLGSLWRDEINSVNTQRAATLAAMWRIDEFESFPLLWQLLLRGWMILGGGASDTTLRLFGGLCALSLPVAMWIAARRTGLRMPMAGLALLAINPEVIRWACTLRPWSLGAALGILTMVWIKDAALAPSRRTLAVATLLAVLAVQCLYQNAFFLAAAVAGIGVVALRRRDWTVIRAPLAIGMIAALSLLPYAGLIARRSAWNMLGEVPLTLAHLMAGAGAIFGASGVLASLCWIVLIVGAMSVALWQLDRVVTTPEETAQVEGSLFFATTLAASALGLGGFYLWFRYAPHAWYYLGFVAIAALAAECAARLATSSPLAPRAAVAVAVVALAGGTVPSLSALQMRQTNVDAIAAYVSRAAGSGDLVVVNPWYLAITFQRYYHGPGAVESIPPLDDHLLHRYDLVKVAMSAADPVRPVLDRIERVLASGHRVWFVGSIDLPMPDEGMPLLEPPPRATTGWSLVPYQQIWSLQVGTFLEAHVASGHRVHIDDEGGPLEASMLTELSGWR